LPKHHVPAKSLDIFTSAALLVAAVLLFAAMLKFLPAKRKLPDVIYISEEPKIAVPETIILFAKVFMPPNVCVPIFTSPGFVTLALCSAILVPYMEAPAFDAEPVSNVDIRNVNALVNPFIEETPLTELEIKDLNKADVSARFIFSLEMVAKDALSTCRFPPTFASPHPVTNEVSAPISSNTSDGVLV
jgi:hypothetical protein